MNNDLDVLAETIYNKGPLPDGSVMIGLDLTPEDQELSQRCTDDWLPIALIDLSDRPDVVRALEQSSEYRRVRDGFFTHGAAATTTVLVMHDILQRLLLLMLTEKTSLEAARDTVRAMMMSSTTEGAAATVARTTVVEDDPDVAWQTVLGSTELKIRHADVDRARMFMRCLGFVPEVRYWYYDVEDPSQVHEFCGERPSATALSHLHHFATALAFVHVLPR